MAGEVGRCRDGALRIRTPGANLSRQPWLPSVVIFMRPPFQRCSQTVRRIGVARRLGNFYRGAADPDGVRLAFGVGALWIIGVIIWATGIFSAAMQEEVERAQHGPMPTVEQLAELYSGHGAPAIPAWPRESRGEPLQKSATANQP